MAPITRLNLTENDGFNVSEVVQHPDVPGTAKSDIPFIFRIESNSATTCWPSSRLDIMSLSQADKRNWMKVLKAFTTQNVHSSLSKYKKYRTILRLEKHQVSDTLNRTILYLFHDVRNKGRKKGFHKID
jgi:citron Rho-interacting kinase